MGRNCDHALRFFCHDASFHLGDTTNDEVAGMRPREQIWRWDQGKLRFLRYPNIVGMARAFAEFDGLDLTLYPDVIAQRLRELTDQQFPIGQQPGYDVFRQYQRTFRLSLLAAKINCCIAATPVCKSLAAEANSLTVDDYLALFSRRFSMPSPAFQRFSSDGSFVFPVAALLKLLLAKSIANPLFSLDEASVLRYIKGNEMLGTEPLEAYIDLAQKEALVGDKELRQVSEMLAFVAQFSWLDWERKELRLSSPIQWNEAVDFVARIEPDVFPIGLTRDAAFFAVSSLNGGIPAVPDVGGVATSDFFVEGSRASSYHMRIERSRRLKVAMLDSLPTPASCQMCVIVPTRTYPWVDLLLEAHHLLPLASPLRTDSEGTKLSDLAALCPNCHRAVHVFYRLYLKRHMIPDFTSVDEARNVFEQARSSIVLSP